MYEEMIARARFAELARENPQSRFVREYHEMSAVEKMEARLAEARRRVEVAAARIMPAR